MSTNDYRHWLVQAHHKATQDFDRAVVVLAGGALDHLRP